MAKKESKMDDKFINQHKKMAMGDKVTGMKTGGKVEKKKEEKKSEKKSEKKKVK